MDGKIIERNECVNKIEIFVRDLVTQGYGKGKFRKNVCWSIGCPYSKEALKHSKKTDSMKKNVILPSK